MVVVRSPFPDHVGATDVRARRTRWFVGLLLAGSLALNAVLLLRSPDPRPVERPRPDAAPAAAAGAAPESDSAPAEDPSASGSEPEGLEEEVARLRKRLEPFERMAPGDAIVFSRRDFGWILRRLWDLPPEERTAGIDRLAHELKRRKDGADLVIAALFEEQDPAALSALAAVLERGDFSSAVNPREELPFQTNEPTRLRIAETVRRGEPAERRLAAARALADFGVQRAEGDDAGATPAAIAAALGGIREPAVAEALAQSLIDDDTFILHTIVSDALLAASGSGDRRSRRAFLKAYAYGEAAASTRRLEAQWDVEPSRERREDLAYAFAHADVHRSPPSYGKEPEAVRTRARERFLAAYREATDLEARRYLAAATFRTGACLREECAGVVAAFLAAESDPAFRGRLQALAERLGRGEQVDAVASLLAEK